MHPSLTNLLASVTSQPASKRPVSQTPAWDPPGLALGRENKPRPQEFMLPPETRDQAAPAQPSRKSSDQETPGPRSAREWAPRREDPPHRSDSPRGTDRSSDGEPPRRLDPPRGPERAADGAPPRRDDPPGLAKREEASPAPVVEAGETTLEGAAKAGDEGVALCAAGETPAAEAIIPVQVVDTVLLTATAAATSVSGTGPLSGRETMSGEPAQALNLGAETGSADAGAPLPDGQVSQAQDPELKAQDPELQTVQAVDAQDNEIAKEEEKVLTSEAHEGAIVEGQVPGADLPVAEGAEAVAATQQAAAMAAAAQTAGPTITAAATRNSSDPMQQADAIEAKGSSAPRQEHASVREQDESARPEARVDAVNTATRESSASEGSGPKGAAKPDQFLPQAPEAGSAAQPAASGALSREPSSTMTQAPAAPIRVVSEVPLGAVPVEIGLKSLAGVNHFEIRLDPGELGRIEVRLEIDKEGGVKAHLTVDKVETLALLQRDSRTLERAFEQAGLKPTDGSVDLSLRDQQTPGQGRHDQGGDQRREGSRSSNADIARQDLEPPAESLRRHWRGAAGVDVRI